MFHLSRRHKAFSFRRAQSTRNAKCDPRTLSRKYSENTHGSVHENVHGNAHKGRGFPRQTLHRVPAKTPTRVLTANSTVLTAKCTTVSLVSFHISYFRTSIGIFCEQGKPEVCHYCLKRYKARYMPVKRDKKLAELLSLNWASRVQGWSASRTRSERDWNEIQICII